MNIDDELFEIFIYIIMVLVFLGIISIFFDDYKERVQWDKYRTDHACKIVDHIDGYVFNTLGTDAKGNISVGIASTPDKTGWLCDDGITYYK